jgi:endogenous inhibitor of DNA gyrase (YacG/DUF329 family)
MAEDKDTLAIKPAGPCPICGKPAKEKFAPFCSARCQDVDLNRWLSGVYVIPGEKLEEDDTPETRSGEDDED